MQHLILFWSDLVLTQTNQLICKGLADFWLFLYSHFAHQSWQKSAVKKARLYFLSTALLITKLEDGGCAIFRGKGSKSWRGVTCAIFWGTDQLWRHDSSTEADKMSFIRKKQYKFLSPAGKKPLIRRLSGSWRIRASSRTSTRRWRGNPRRDLRQKGTLIKAIISAWIVFLLLKNPGYGNQVPYFPLFWRLFLRAPFSYPSMRRL